MKETYISYKKIPSELNLKPGDVIYLSSDILALAWTAVQNGESFEAEELIDSFQRQITEEGTLIIPSFHFNFSNKGSYDYWNTPSSSGALGNTALKREDFRRTKHPMHSFCVWGKGQEILCEMENLNSFGADSPFAWMHENHAVQVMLGTDYQRSMTFVHYVEYMADVPYRFPKEFTGTYTEESGRKMQRTYQYPARKLELGSVEKFNRIGRKLEEQGAAESYEISGILVKKVMLAESYPIIYEDAAYNMCRNLYDFSGERELIWK